MDHNHVSVSLPVFTRLCINISLVGIYTDRDPIIHTFGRGSVGKMPLSNLELGRPGPDSLSSAPAKAQRKTITLCMN